MVSGEGVLATRAKLSTLWIVIMFSMLAADILGSYLPGAQAEMLEFAGGTPITTLMLAAAVLMALPIAMIYFSRVLKRAVNRWANIVVGVITTLYVVGGGSTHPHYLVLASIEVVAALAIIWNAWKWNASEGAA